MWDALEGSSTLTLRIVHTLFSWYAYLAAEWKIAPQRHSIEKQQKPANTLSSNIHAEKYETAKKNGWYQEIAFVTKNKCLFVIVRRVVANNGLTTAVTRRSMSHSI